MGEERIKTNKDNFIECDRQLKEQSISGKNDKVKTTKVVKELTAIGTLVR